jgi:hypothetical protein
MNDCVGCEEISLPIGTPGEDGKNAFTTTTAGFNQPASGFSVPVSVSDLGQLTNQWAIPGQVVFLADVNGFGGYYQVVSITGSTTIDLLNLGYASNSADSTPIAFPAKVSPAGIAGPAGSPGIEGPAGPSGASSNLLLSSYDNRFAVNTIGAEVVYTGVIPAGSVSNLGDTIRIDIPMTFFDGSYGDQSLVYVTVDTGGGEFQVCSTNGYSDNQRGVMSISLIKAVGLTRTFDSATYNSGAGLPNDLTGVDLSLEITIRVYIQELNTAGSAIMKSLTAYKLTS